MTPEAMAFASERLGNRLIDTLVAATDLLDGCGEGEVAAVFAFAAVGAAMSTLIATGTSPADAAARLAACATGVAEDLA